jgi:hypothetical protein
MIHSVDTERYRHSILNAQNKKRIVTLLTEKGFSIFLPAFSTFG